MTFTIGYILKEIRIRSGLTLRTFCLGHKLDAVRYSLVERDQMMPNTSEINEYLDLIKKSG